jgi:DNA-binding response OmpR family regulator
MSVAAVRHVDVVAVSGQVCRATHSAGPKSPLSKARQACGEELMRVLVIDDEPNDRLLARHELSRHFVDLQIEDIRAEIDLRRALDSGPVDLVITDFQLRWTDGIEVLERVKERFPDCAVVMFTSTGTQEIAVAAMKAGLDDYVIKAAAHYVRLPVAVEGALRRATARSRGRRSQRRFDEMLSAIGVGVFRFGPSGELREANGAMLSLLRASSLDQLRSLDLSALLRAARDAQRASTVTAPQLGGGQIVLSVSGEPVEDPDGTPVIEGVVRPASDIRPQPQ